MLVEALSDRVYLAAGSTDMRKSIDTLAVLVKEGFKLDPFSSSLFVFCSRDRTRLKILLWDHNGWWLYLRRLEKGKFDWPEGSNKVTSITRRELRWLLDGLPIKQRHAHPEVTARLLL